MSNSKNRLAKEIFQLNTEKIPGIEVIEEDFPQRLILQVQSNCDSIYEGQSFILQFIYKKNYPFSPPIVQFIESPIPVHPHIYSNGHICLSILDSDWTPAMSTWSVCLSIVSMLNSCKEKILPPDNESYVKKNVSDPSQTRWHFHGIFLINTDDDI